MEGKMVLTTTREVDASHKLNDYEGKCANIHGHRWKIEVDVSIKVKSLIHENSGMVLDFNVVKNVIDRLDHKMINELEPFDNYNPTAENLSIYIASEIKKSALDKGIEIDIESVRVWETPDNKAEFIPE
jgi:6-pyruvoyltetrahydropterin/6-carboxytetrahydropterin synthase